MVVMLVPACGTSSPVSFATSARFSCSRPESAAAAFIAGVNGGEEEPEQRTADRLQGLGHTGAFLEQDALRIALALQQLGRQRRAHFGGQVRLRVPPNRIA